MNLLQWFFIKIQHCGLTEWGWRYRNATTEDLFTSLSDFFLVDNPCFHCRVFNHHVWMFLVSPDFCFCWGSLKEETDSQSSLLWPRPQMHSLCLHPHCTQISAPAITNIKVYCNKAFYLKIVLSPSYRFVSVLIWTGWQINLILNYDMYQKLVP